MNELEGISQASPLALKLFFSGLLGIMFLPLSTPCHAHESRPSYLELSERVPGRYEVIWRRPTFGDQALALAPQFPQECRDATPRMIYTASGSVVERWTLTCNETSLSGRSIAITGLSSTITDVLVRVSLAAGVAETHVLRASAPSFTVRGTPSRLDVINSYLALGVAHILSGIDHLLFILGLLLIVQGRWLLLKTVTAFTVAHSMTLGLATLGFVHVPQAPVEAVIALSILFLAAELARQQEHEKSLMALCPWVVAFSFGLLHGFGFAGALTEVGLPPTDIPLALLMFNIGVEMGQLLFIAGMFVVAYGAQRWIVVPTQGWRRAAAYGIGSVSAFWVIQRVAAFF